jgi:Xaa-Pro aminopeptidase
MRNTGLAVIVVSVCTSLTSSSLFAQTQTQTPTPTPTPTPEQTFFEWTELPHSAEVFEGRRRRLLERLRETGGGLLLVPSRPGPSDGFTFRQLDDFLYLTGLELPDSMLVLDTDEKRAVLFAPARDARYDNPSRRNDFPGRLLTADPDFRSGAGLADIRSIEELSESVSQWARSGRLFRVNVGRAGAVPLIESSFMDTWSHAEALLFHLQERYPTARVTNAFEPVARVRMVHGPEEIDSMRRVCELTMAAIRHAASFVTQGVTERELEAELEAAYKRGGSQRLAFASIIKSGPNSLWPWRILAANYDRRNRAMSDGELVIFDVGTELDYYVSDVGRTFPVSGSFTKEQRRALEMSTSVSDAIIAAIRPGVTFPALKAIAVEAIPEEERPYMQAGGFFGHHIGLSTGDPALADARLEPGMIFTVEPWYYNHDRGVSVFVEDVILVTRDGNENLTAALPRSPEELEKMVRGR